MKLEAMAPARSGGAEDESGRDQSDTGRGCGRENAPLFIEDGAHREIAAGAGTIAQEMTAADTLPDFVLVPIGDGALITGIGTRLRATAPATRVIGVTAV